MEKKSKEEREKLYARLAAMHNEVKDLKTKLEIGGAATSDQTKLAMKTLDMIDNNIKMFMKYRFEGGKKKPEYEEGEESEAPPEEYIPEDYIEEE